MVTALSFSSTGSTSCSRLQLASYGIRELHFTSRYANSGLTCSGSSVRSGLNVFSSCGWQGQWPSRGLSNSTFPNTVRTCDVVMTPVLADAATLGAAARLEQRIVHLFVDHSRLDALQHQFAFRQSKAEGFHGDAGALEFGPLAALARGRRR